MLPAMAHTHELVYTGRRLVKRYTSWERGEHVREWSVLRRVHHHLPRLVPRPIAADLETVPPSITMAVIPGGPPTGDLTRSQGAALAAAITALWRVPGAGIVGVTPWSSDLDFGRRLTAGPRPAAGLTATAYDAATAWWHGPDPELLSRPPRTMVLGHRDPNRDNYLWDGSRIRVVDFEDAGLSDPATELAILVEHLSWRDTDCGPLLARIPVDERRFLAARRLWAMFWLRRLLPGSESDRRRPADVADRQACRLLRLLGR
ncbi:phosphotransferase family protein [Actinoplanes sp. NPDC004185]